MRKKYCYALGFLNAYYLTAAENEKLELTMDISYRKQGDEYLYLSCFGKLYYG